MTSWGRAIGYGVLIWTLVFVVAVAVFPFRESWRSLFESVMAVAVAAMASFFAVVYFRRVRAHHAREGLGLGGIWLAINVAIDLPMMLAGPMEMTPTEYIADIGLTYLIFPAVACAVGLACARQAPRA